MAITQSLNQPELQIAQNWQGQSDFYSDIMTQIAAAMHMKALFFLVSLKLSYIDLVVGVVAPTGLSWK